MKKPAARKPITIEKKFIAQVKFYEVLFQVRDSNGELIFTGSEETAKKIQKALARKVRK